MTFIEEAVISGFISKAINNCIDVSWVKIKKIVKNNKYQNMESQIYSIIISVLNQITYNKYKNDQDKIYQSAEKLLVGCKNANCVNIEVIRSGLQVLEECVNDDKYVQFKILLYQELSKDNYVELYRAVELWQRDEENSNIVRIEHNIDEVRQGVREIKQAVLNEKMENEENSLTIHNVKFQYDKKRDYIKNWNSRMFLNQDNDENPITLADAFIMPDYKLDTSIQKIGFSDNDALDKIIEKFIEYDKTSTMLITGVPGIGKSTIISWIANKYKDFDNIIVLRFRDWEREELEKGLLKSICISLECKKRDLERKILVLDGFDEAKSLDIRDRLLNDFFTNIKDFENFKCIITSRPDYINSNNFSCVVRLNEFDIKRVEDFVKIITGDVLENCEKIESNLEVLGIPVILYMAIMSSVDISENPTKPELYNRIFAESGGIFDKFYDGVNQYSEGSQILRNSENVRKYLFFLRETAFKMFEKKDLVLTKDEYKIPELSYQGYSVSILEFPIKHLFENTSANIEFIHKSIYEYFVAEYIYKSMEDVLLNEEENVLIDLADVFGRLFTSQRLSDEILEFLKFRIRSGQLKGKFEIINGTFQLMLKDGMTYHTNRRYKNIIDIELTIFANMLEIVHVWWQKYYKFDNSIYKYFHVNEDVKLNLRKAIISDELQELDHVQIDLRYVDLREANLRDFNSGKNSVDLRYADLRNADLIEVCFKHVDLRYVDLRGVYLVGARLQEVDLRNANLRGAHLTYANMKNVDLRGADLRGAYLTYAKLENLNLDNAFLTDIVIDESQIKYLKKYILQGIEVNVKNIGKYVF